MPWLYPKSEKPTTATKVMLTRSDRPLRPLVVVHILAVQTNQGPSVCAEIKKSWGKSGKERKDIETAESGVL